MKLSPTQIQEIAERAEKATEGEWVYDEGDSGEDACPPGVYNTIHSGLDCCLLCECDVVEHGQQNLVFAAHARQDIPNLLAHIAAQDGEIAQLERERDEANSNLSSAYLYITNGMIGKPNSDPMAVRAIGDDIATKLVEDEAARLRARIAQLESQIAMKDGALKKIEAQDDADVKARALEQHTRESGMAWMARECAKIAREALKEGAK